MLEVDSPGVGYKAGCGSSTPLMAPPILQLDSRSVARIMVGFS